MVNLLDETIDILLNHGKFRKDVEFVVGHDSSVKEDCLSGCDNNSHLVRTTWDEFVSQADKMYDNGFGGVEVFEITMIVGKDFWLERHSYDGTEWWEYKELPKAENYREGSIRVFNRDYEE